MGVRLLPELPQLRQQLKKDVLAKIVQLGAVQRAVDVEVQLVADDALNDRLQMRGDQLRQKRLILLIASRQERHEQRIECRRFENQGDSNLDPAQKRVNVDAPDGYEPGIKSALSSAGFAGPFGADPCRVRVRYSLQCGSGQFHGGKILVAVHLVW